ncbi:tripartite ATP-independent transporter DctP family solute receptor [Bradyrhizobium japonicum]|uniref:Tripartite ATP-independent transporter DctP family solute receptor n=1 Tax=Bradyrhizobium elkanii TaxID=29448 RepID=A0A4Q4K6P9_BRAEL|nr:MULTISPECIES: TRAP transporter substrate-binding protein [Bradyrhizobium]MBP1299107.1 tripartite ATP-independent transporter DctP family solute receptor [Bradyrhizobium elkanii]MCP1729580.1 tripartite ATP-independent transporter DctP family solute receptor [Bradyrhizobium elkanii]MCP1756320.1 tripartite ATP-independent transporter DctP family solute receptor [Bradyrhizobium elkanii]MCP1981833.1 tripartite ATP-independent transporter DctP family solute receptor [Bradyrhizobium elkanii]MCS348
MGYSAGIVGIAVAAAALLLPPRAGAQEVKHYRFAHDQQLNTGYSVAYDMFSAKLKELSKGTMIVDQYPGAQLGQEPQLLQLVKSGDIEFAIISSANTATISPQAGVMSLHFLFRDANHVVKALADQKVIDAIKAMIDDTSQGLHVIATGSQGVRSIYARKEIHNVSDLKGVKIRVQATATEDTIFPAYAAQTVHMPFGSVYTSLQTGVVDAAENSVNVYLVNKHYEVAPVLSMTEHEANNALLFVSDKLWQSLSAEQKTWVTTAAAEVSAKEPAKAFELEKNAAAKLKSFGVKVVEDVDKKSFTAIADPYLDKLAKDLGPHAEKIKNLIRAVN